MRRYDIHALAAVVAAGAWAAACGSNEVGADPIADAVGLEARPYPDGPDGPFGVQNGQIVENMAFSGYFAASATTGVSDEFEADIDFQQVRDLGRYRFMLVNIAAEWCSGCRIEAQLLPGKFRAWDEAGGFVFSVIIEDQLSNPATANNLDRWLSTYPINYTMVHDPQNNINGKFAPPGLPLNVIIDLETMEILSQKVGEDLRFLDLFESLLE